jgi:hypothetical protein
MSRTRFVLSRIYAKTSSSVTPTVKVSCAGGRGARCARGPDSGRNDREDRATEILRLQGGLRSGPGGRGHPDRSRGEQYLTDMADLVGFQ